jgi:hypothetical protein
VVLQERFDDVSLGFLNHAVTPSHLNERKDIEQKNVASLDASARKLGEGLPLRRNPVNWNHF